jgi:hypothetical protein
VGVTRAPASLRINGDDLYPVKARVLLMLAIATTTDPNEVARIFREYKVTTRARAVRRPTARIGARPQLQAQRQRRRVRRVIDQATRGALVAAPVSNQQRIAARCASSSAAQRASERRGRARRWPARSVDTNTPWTRAREKAVDAANTLSGVRHDHRHERLQRSPVRTQHIETGLERKQKPIAPAAVRHQRRLTTKAADSSS